MKIYKKISFLIVIAGVLLNLYSGFMASYLMPDCKSFELDVAVGVCRIPALISYSSVGLIIIGLVGIVFCFFRKP